MLSIPTEFPHVGSTAYIRGSGHPCRIIQRNANGTCLVSLTDRRWRHEAASGNTTHALTDLFATPEEAFANPQPRRPRRRTAA